MDMRPYLGEPTKWEGRQQETDPYGLNLHEAGAKADAGKLQAGLLADFGLALQAVAGICTHGAVKYSRGGWQHVEQGIERYTDAMWRHLLKSRYEAVDPDSGLLHWSHFAWNVLAILELTLRNMEEKNEHCED